MKRISLTEIMAVIHARVHSLACFGGVSVACVADDEHPFMS